MASAEGSEPWGSERVSRIGGCLGRPSDAWRKWGKEPREWPGLLLIADPVGYNTRRHILRCGKGWNAEVGGYTDGPAEPITS